MMERKIAELISPVAGVSAELIEVVDMFARFEDYEGDVLYRARVPHTGEEINASVPGWFVIVDPEMATLRILSESDSLTIPACDELETLRQAVLAEMPTRYDAGPH